MFYKVGDIRVYLLNNEVREGKIISVNEKFKNCTIEDLQTKERYIVNEDNIFF